MRIPPALVDAVVALAESARRLPELGSRIDARVRGLERNIAAMRDGVSELAAVRSAVAPLDARMRALERELVGVREAVEPLDQRLADSMGSMEHRMQETAQLQRQTNEGIDGLNTGVAPLEGGIDKVRENTAALTGQMDQLGGLMSRMLDELAALRRALEPLAPAAARVGRLSERLPGS